ncbi:MAG: ATP-binding cassette domain-containing protein [Deltaproteobacteria bacterium]|nr:ATP-binding cassette domain-containing protein [Deltaproteobacteria bacterium]
MATLVTLDNVSIRLKGKVFLKDISWQIKEGENWAILGPNGSGKSTLARALTGTLPVVKGKLVHHFLDKEPNTTSAGVEHYFGYVSLEFQRELMEAERFREECRDFSGRIDEITPVRSILESGMSGVGNEGEKRQILEQLAKKLEIKHLLNRSITRISTGEMRKAIIARALMKNPKLLILDEPFDGLDQSSHASLAKMINELMSNHSQVVLITHRFEEMLDGVSHVLYLRNGRIGASGKKEEIFTPGNARKFYSFREKGANAVSPAPDEIYPGAKGEHSISAGAGDRPVIEIKKATVKYGSRIVLDNLDWTVRPGEKWAVLGPNGCGKSTILKLVTGENLQSYANDVFLFGKKRGSGESIWDVKRRMGVFSSELQSDYPKSVKALDVVCSGFFDSLGLYRNSDRRQRQTALKWMKKLDIEALAEETFEMLSFGQRQMVLIARAMVKSPELLILDEPCEGLDIANRYKLLKVIDGYGMDEDASLIYVTHHQEDIPSSITHMLKFSDEKFISSKREKA